jgi:GntR family transcriptional repressor for pyruvate dehydrogenase complex
MMQMLGKSRPTIREALRMLERNGLIMIIPGSKGAVVKAPGSVSVEEPLENLLTLNLISSGELLEYRKLNEVSAAGWAAERRTEDDLFRIRRCLNDFDPAASGFDSFSEKDIAFHQAIAEASHNRVATMVDKVIHRLVANILEKAYERKTEDDRRLMMKQIFESHRKICTAIENGDPGAAKEAMTEHMSLIAADVMTEE